MVKQCTFVALLAAVALLPVGAAQGRSDLDSAPPFIILDVTGKLGANGWHVENTRVAWSYGPGPEIDSTVGCDTKTVRVETKGIPFTCTVTNKVGQTVSTTYVVKLDKTPPTVTVRPSRQADRNGWFNHRVGFTVEVEDDDLRVGRLQLGPDPTAARTGLR